MTATVRSSGTYASAATEASTSGLTLPSGWQPGDVIYIGWELTAATGTVTTPSGWALAVPAFVSAVGTTPTSGHTGVFRRVMASGDAAPVISFTSGRFAADLLAIQGADNATPEDVTPVTDDNTGVAVPSVRAPSIVPVTPGCLLITFHAVRNATTGATTAFTPDASETEQADTATTVAAVSEAAIEAATLALTDTSATGTKTATATGSNVTSLNTMGVAIAVRPAVAATIQPQPGSLAWKRRYRRPQQAWQLPSVPPGAGPPLVALHGPVRAQAAATRGGQVTRRAGTFQGAGPPAKPASGPVRARQLPVRGGSVTRRSGTFAGLGPALKALASAISARLRVLPPRGRTAGRSGTYAQAGPPVTPPRGPVHAVRTPQPGGRAQARAGTFTAVTLGSGPPVYPLGHPVQARRLPQRGGSTSSRAGTRAQAGPPVRALSEPVKAQPPPQRGGHAASRSGTLTAGAPQAGPPVYPLGHPVTARRLPARGGSVSHRAGVFGQAGPPVTPLRKPVGVYRQQPPPPARGRVLSLDGIRAGTGPPAIPLRRPVRGQPARPFRTGRAAWRAGAYTAPVVAPFTVGALTARDAPGAVLTAGSGGSVLTAATAAQGTLTARDQRTGGPG